LLKQVRQATAAYRDVAAAKAAGYVPLGPCAADPKYGGMGMHYVSEEHGADGVLDPLRPEALVYEPTRNGTLRLGAVEYVHVDAVQAEGRVPARHEAGDRLTPHQDVNLLRHIALCPHCRAAAGRLLNTVVADGRGSLPAPRLVEDVVRRHGRSQRIARPPREARPVG
jgi:hypothetical protein